jgi:hypothetical protein
MQTGNGDIMQAGSWRRSVDSFGWFDTSSLVILRLDNDENDSEQVTSRLTFFFLFVLVRLSIRNQTSRTPVILAKFEDRHDQHGSTCLRSIGSGEMNGDGGR